MIKKIAHLADIHIRKTPTRNEEYQQVFDRIIISLKEQKPDRIVIVGDLVHDYLDLQGEQLIMAHNFLKELVKIAPVRTSRGNHDCRKKNLKRVDSIKAIVETVGDFDVEYYNETGFVVDDNVIWAIWHHGQPKNNPWKTKEGKKIKAYNDNNGFTTIDLFHDPITGCMSTTDFEMKSKSYYKISDFKGDLSLFGDIHRMQYLDKNQTKAYCGSLIAQDITEGDGAFHGYLLWDVEDRVATPIPIHNDYSYHNIKLTPYTDFEDLDLEIDEPTKFMTVRFVWGTLPQTRIKENERSVIEHIKSKYKNVKISHKNEFIETEDIDINESITLENVTDEAVQQEIFREFLEKIGTKEEIIDDVITLDEEILKEIDILNEQSIEWDIIKFGGNNFMSYEKLDIDWRKLDGLFQITGANTAGKTTIMKIISYVLFGKTLETETRMKFGDKRFVNNRNGASSCDSYIVIEANGEYFGVKKLTKIEKKRDGSISGAPTTLSYYVLGSPDDEMNDETALEKLDGDRRAETQKKINSIIGSYDNFMRIVMTTSDTLNRILSNDMAVFIDSILYDSGLDIFDKKLEGLKVYQKRFNEKPKITCNVELTNESNSKLILEINTLNNEIYEIEDKKLPEIDKSIIKGRAYIEKLTKKLYQIDPEIYNLDVDVAREDISANQKNIVEIRAREMVLRQSVNALRETYDENKLNELIEKRDTHKQLVYDKNLEIKALERDKADFQHRIEIINGTIFTLKKDGKSKKDAITELRESKTCPTCGQLMTEEHQEHVDLKIKKIEEEMYQIANDIKVQDKDILLSWQPLIDKCDKDVIKINENIVTLGLDMENVLTEIGTLTNEMNDVNKRKELQAELDLIPTRVQNEELKIGILNEKIIRHENSLKQIEENQRIEKGIAAAKTKVDNLELEETDAKEDVFIRKTSIGDKNVRYKENQILIADFKIQEYQNSVMALYKKCVHRDGIPRQMLSNHIIPKINVTLENILSVASFKVWLDADDLRPKLAYNDRPNSVIDCIGASGKERTFSSVVLKFALNQINVKAKPSIFLLDEVMGKLDENSVEEFIEILQMIKLKMKKVLVIEHTVNLDPDYLIDVELDENGISSLKII